MKKLSKLKTKIVILLGAFVSILAGLTYAEDLYEYETFPAQFNLRDLNGTNGFAINGIRLGDFSGADVSGAGDVNGDGIADLLIGARGINNERGQSYVVFGSKESWSEVIYLINLNGTNGFAINGIKTGDHSGSSVSGAGDVNGDGIDDILIGASRQSYLVFGSKQAWSAAINLADLNGKNGFIINGGNVPVRNKKNV